MSLMICRKEIYRRAHGASKCSAFVSLKYSDMFKWFQIVLSAPLTSSFGLMPHDRLQGLLQFDRSHAGHSCQHLCLHFRESDATGKTSEGKPENNRFLFSEGEMDTSSPRPSLCLGCFFFWAVPSFHWWKKITFFYFIFPTYILQHTEGKLNCPIFITLLAVLAQYCASSYSTKRQLLHRRRMPCLLGTDSPDSSLSHG